MPKFIKKVMKSMTSILTSKNNNEENSVDDNYVPRNNGGQCVGGKVVFNEADEAKPPCAVIVTIKSGSSYDDLFTANQQVAPDETVAVKVFHFNYLAIPDILRAIEGLPCELATPEVSAIIQEMLECRKQVDADSFVINFECCSGCSCKGFERNTSESVRKLLAWMIQEQHVAMFADFSLKSLIADWSPEHLGPNPFVNVGETCEPLELHFDPEKLLESPNTQLQNLGRMCNKGRAYVNVLPSTIVFTIDQDNAKNGSYELEVLTFAKSSSGRTVGHAILRYPTGASILVSSGHWIELNHLDGVEEDSLIKTTELTMGLTEASDLRRELDSVTTHYEKCEVMQRRAKRTLLSSAPCKYSSKGI